MLLPWNLVTHFGHFCDQKPSHLDAYEVNLCHSSMHFLTFHPNYGTFEKGSEYIMLVTTLSLSQAAYWTIFKEQGLLSKSNLHNWFFYSFLFARFLLWCVILTWPVLTSSSLVVAMKNVFSGAIKPLLDSSIRICCNFYKTLSPSFHSTNVSAILLNKAIFPVGFFLSVLNPS